MQLVSEKAWLEMRQAYIQQGEAEGEAIVELVTAWADKIEELVESGDYSFRGAMDDALPEVDVEQLRSDMMSEVVFIMSQVWEHGDTLVENLTYLERRVFETAIAEKLKALQVGAGSSE